MFNLTPRDRWRHSLQRSTPYLVRAASAVFCVLASWHHAANNGAHPPPFRFALQGLPCPSPDPGHGVLCGQVLISHADGPPSVHGTFAAAYRYDIRSLHTARLDSAGRFQITFAGRPDRVELVIAREQKDRGGQSDLVIWDPRSVRSVEDYHRTIRLGEGRAVVTVQVDGESGLATYDADPPLPATPPQPPPPPPPVTPSAPTVRPSDQPGNRDRHLPYPQVAINRGIEGAVMVMLDVSARGQPKNARIVSGPAEFHDTALEAARRWRFSPATRDGKRVAYRGLTRRLVFRLD